MGGGRAGGGGGFDTSLYTSLGAYYGKKNDYGIGYSDYYDGTGAAGVRKSGDLNPCSTEAQMLIAKQQLTAEIGNSTARGNIDLSTLSDVSISVSETQIKKMVEECRNSTMKMVFIAGGAFLCCGVVMFTIVIKSCMVERRLNVTASKTANEEFNKQPGQPGEQPPDAEKGKTPNPDDSFDEQDSYQPAHENEDEYDTEENQSQYSSRLSDS